VTKKDYIAFAKAIKEEQEQGSFHASLDSLVNRICDIFVADNPRFDREKFLKACDG